MAETRYASGSPPGAQPSGPPTSAPKGQAWHPQVSFLITLVLAEYLALVLLRFVFRHVHGG